MELNQELKKEQEAKSYYDVCQSKLKRACLSSRIKTES